MACTRRCCSPKDYKPLRPIIVMPDPPLSALVEEARRNTTWGRDL